MIILLFWFDFYKKEKRKRKKEDKPACLSMESTKNISGIIDDFNIFFGYLGGGDFKINILTRIQISLFGAKVGSMLMKSVFGFVLYFSFYF